MEKIYYSISEVADMFDINLSKLRYWEKEFKQLTPKRNEGGTRFYTTHDIEIIKQIIFLTGDKKLKIDGAKKSLLKNKDDVVKKQEIVERLKSIKLELKGILKQL